MEQVDLLKATSFIAEGALKLYSNNVRILLKHYVTGNRIAVMNSEVHIICQGLMTRAECGRCLRLEAFSCGSVYVKKTLNDLFVEEVTMLICKTHHCWWAKQQYASLGDLA